MKSLPKCSDVLYPVWIPGDSRRSNVKHRARWRWREFSQGGGNCFLSPPAGFAGVLFGGESEERRGAKQALIPCVYGVYPVWPRCGPGVDPRLISESPVFAGLPWLFLYISGTCGLGDLQELTCCFAAGGSRRTGDSARSCYGVHTGRLRGDSYGRCGLSHRHGQMKSLRARSGKGDHHYCSPRSHSSNGRLCFSRYSRWFAARTLR